MAKSNQSLYNYKESVQLLNSYIVICLIFRCKI